MSSRGSDPIAWVQYEIDYIGRKESDSMGDVNVTAGAAAFNAVSPPSATARATYQPGCAAKIKARLHPLHVSFHHLHTMEGVVEASYVWGCCTNTALFPPGSLDHDVDAGGNEVLHVEGQSVSYGNFVADDRVLFVVAVSEDSEPPFEPGGYTWDIPWIWYAGDNGISRSLGIVRQVGKVFANGRVSISKFGATVFRDLYGDESCSDLKRFYFPRLWQ